MPESYNLKCIRTPEVSYLMDEKPANTLESYPYEGAAVWWSGVGLNRKSATSMALILCPSDTGDTGAKAWRTRAREAPRRE
jgi:hypothetical protein